MKIRIYKILCIFIAGMAMGCASNGVKSSNNAMLGKGVDTSSFQMMSVDAKSKKNPAECPSSATSWRGEKYNQLMVLANACASLGKGERLEQLGALMAKKDHDQPWGAFYLSLASEMNKDYRRALWMIDLAIKKSPTQALFSYQKGRILWELDERGASVAMHNEAIKKNPNFLNAHIFLAKLYLRDQNWSGASSHFKTILSLDSSNVEATMGLGETLLAEKSVSKATEYFEKAVDLAPRNIQLKVKLAHIYEVQQKNYPLALAMYKRIQVMMSDARSPSDQVSVNVKDKIQRLEALLAPRAPAQGKLTKAENANGVKK